MRPLNFAVQRVRGVLAEIDILKDEDFPYRHSRLALAEIARSVHQRLELLEKISEADDPNAVMTACNASLQQLFRLLPLLGFVVRSTNVRNSFEVFWPLLRLARQILGPDVKLILSSEWSLSPLYRPTADLPEFVLLGFPASESGNPLLLPLAGHELGHTTWQREKLADLYGPMIQKQITDGTKRQQDEYKHHFGRNVDNLFTPQDLAPAFVCALRQAEETFCDFFGVRLFGVSYLHAFAYLLTPWGVRRSPEYPDLKRRIQNILLATESAGIEPPSDFATAFLDELPLKCSEKDGFLLRLADASSGTLTDQLLTNATSICDRASVPKHTHARTEKIISDFKLMTPASGIGNLTDILAAGWELYYDELLWDGVVPSEYRLATIYELVLKSVEILEFEERTRHSNDSES